MMNIVTILSCILLISACGNTQDTERRDGEDSRNSGQSAAPQKDYADVFKPLDGRWRGRFIVYTDTLGQREGNVQPKDISRATLDSLPLRQSIVVEVQQEYRSRDAYYQEVQIRDTYTSAEGERKTITSSGVNKVENGQLVCIVNKPDEQVIHSGISEDANTIVWSRDLRNPLKIEYFRESIRRDTYIIVGWGYYGNDDPELSPKTWFYGSYKRVP